MTDILTLGELLVDMTQTGTDEDGNAQFTAYPGGAPANVAVAAARLGAKTGFIGKVGNDAFGRSLSDTLKKENVDTSGLFTCNDVPTTMALVSIDYKGEREFSFYRSPGADTQLTADEAVSAIKGNGDEFPHILHVGSLSMTTMPAREACESAVRFARENGVDAFSYNSVGILTENPEGEWLQKEVYNCGRPLIYTECLEETLIKAKIETHKLVITASHDDLLRIKDELEETLNGDAWVFFS